MSRVQAALTSATVLLALLSVGQFVSGTGSARAAEAPSPTPRDADGRVIISREPGDKTGIWVPDYREAPPRFNVDDVVFKPWARGLYDERQTHDLEPHARCKPSGAVRQFLTPYGVDIVELPELARLYIFDIGGPHSFREVYMDGRSHPVDLEPSHYGHSIGWWEGDSLVVDSVGYNTDFWFERAGLPHTEAAHVTETFTRTDHDTLAYRFELEDPLTYDSPVVGTLTMRWSPEAEMFEYLCQESNYAPDLMVNDAGVAVGSSSEIVP